VWARPARQGDGCRRACSPPLRAGARRRVSRRSHTCRAAAMTQRARRPDTVGNLTTRPCGHSRHEWVRDAGSELDQHKYVRARAIDISRNCKQSVQQYTIQIGLFIILCICTPAATLTDTRRSCASSRRAAATPTLLGRFVGVRPIRFASARAASSPLSTRREHIHRVRPLRWPDDAHADQPRRGVRALGLGRVVEVGRVLVVLVVGLQPALANHQQRVVRWSRQRCISSGR
jgi:hypothetical protein